MTIITQELIDAYADVSGDRNPLHIDPDFAAATPFGRTIAHGQLLLGIIGREIAAHWEPRWSATGRLQVKFVAPVYTGDEVEVEVDDAGTVQLRVGERVCIVGTARLEEER